MSFQRKSILHLTPFAAVGGCEVNCLRIIKACPAFEHRVLIFGDEGPMSPEFEKAGAHVEHLGTWMNGRAAFAESLHRWASSRSKPDGILYWSSSRLNLLLSSLEVWRTPWVVYLGNPLVDGWINGLRRRFDEFLPIPNSVITLAACSSFVAKSHHEKAYFRRFDTEVIYNSVDLEFDRECSYRDLSSGATPRIGMVARLDRIKDHSTLLRALAILAPVRNDIILEFAGDGPMRSVLEEQSRVLGVAERVKFLGFQSVAPLLSQWDIYVHSTTESEGMGTAVAEAMMSGLPCLVSDIEVMREVCGETAVFAAKGDADAFAKAILGLLGDASQRAALGRAGQERARQKFGLLATATRYVRLLFPHIKEEAA